MIRSILKIGVVVVLGLLIYNYFLGSPEEKAQSKEIFGKFKEVGKSIGNMLKTEKGKFDSGKYDNALGKVREMLGNLKSKAGEIGGDYKDKISNLEQKENELENMLKRLKELEQNGTNSIAPGDQPSNEEFVNKFEGFFKEMEKVVDDMERQQ